MGASFDQASVATTTIGPSGIADQGESSQTSHDIYGALAHLELKSIQIEDNLQQMKDH